MPSFRAQMRDMEAPMQQQQQQLLANHKHQFHPQTVSRIVTRIQALALELLPIQVDLEEITSPTSSIITKDVIEAFSQIAGDFEHCLPFALLQARRHFAWQMRINPSDSDENESRKLACEALARKIVAKTPRQDQYSILSARFTVIERDGDESLPLSALETALDQHAIFFLSSNEAQRCVFALWKGLLVQNNDDSGNIEYQLYKDPEDAAGFSSCYNANRIGVPRYQFYFRIWLWLIFIAAYTVAIQTPDRGFGIEDVVLYVQLLGYVVEDLVKIYKIGWWACIGFWQIVNYMIYALSIVAFAYRCADWGTDSTERSDQFRMLSFQFLSCASPLVWAKVLTIFDLYQFFGTLQIVTWRMLKESAVFFVLLGLFGIGFGQALMGLDVADEKRDSTETVIHTLIQALLGSPNFDEYDRGSSSYPFGMILYYVWSTTCIVILLNVLIALFGSAYQECVDESEPTFLAFFAGKTISSIRAPDTYVYPAPFNLVELFILPLEWVLSRKTYAKLNRWIMGVLFCIPLCVIALFESRFDKGRREEFYSLLEEPDEYQECEENPEPWNGENNDGQADDCGDVEEEGKEICKVKFDELKKKMPSLTRSVSGEILWQVKELKKELAAMRQELDAHKAKDQ
ncbi:uncharacterized protein JCM15063_002498 [Sporobolomyces koalae]|uniref:uncharacterized protein n=1 Tax=Sporobolomyces koalae TaxID=500713 RepID=UPI00317C83A5